MILLEYYNTVCILLFAKLFEKIKKTLDFSVSNMITK